MMNKELELLSLNSFVLLHQDITHSIYILNAVVRIPCSLVATRTGVIRTSSSTKPDSRITLNAVLFIVTKDTDSCFGSSTVATHSVETVLVTIKLQRGLGTNQILPPVTTQCAGTVLPVSKQRVQGVCLLVNDNKL